MEKTLWLGWGPGGNHRIEAEWFHDKENFFVWKQPNLSQKTPNAWFAYYDEALAFLHSHIGDADESKKGTHLIVHSFGFQVLLEMIKRKGPLPFSRITVLAARFNSLSSYTNLAEYFSLPEFSSNLPTEAAFLKTFQALTANPDLMDAYWADPKSELHKKYLEIVGNEPLINFETFLAVNLDLVKKFQLREFELDVSLSEPCNFPVDVHLGTLDPLIDVKEEAALWKKYFPNHRLITHACGHFPQFELPTLQIFKDRSA